MSTQTALEAYEEKQAEIEKLLLQIKAGLLAHDRDCTPRHHWGHVGDLSRIANELSDIRDRLHGTGEYEKPLTTFDRKGRKINVTVPLTK